MDAVIAFLFQIILCVLSLYVSPQITVTFVFHVVFLSLSVFEVCRRELGITFQNGGKCGRGSIASLLKGLFLYFHFQRALWFLSSQYCIFQEAFVHTGMCVFFWFFYAMILKYLLIGYFWDIVCGSVNVSCSLSSWQMPLHFNILERS